MPATGINAAYDEALKVIERYGNQKAAEAETAAALLKNAQEAGAGAEEINRLKKEWFDLSVESKINDGEVLWNADQGNYDLSQPVYQYLKEREWRGRPLEILMQRILQMFVLPDMLDPRDVGTPEVQLNIAASGSSVIEPGAVIEPASAREPLEVELVSFREDLRLHTIVMLDLDEPCEEQQSFREQFHWVVTNLAFSKDQNKADLSAGTELLPYIPPHPAHGSPTHRYVVVALEQSNDGQSRLDSADVSRDMVMRDFIAEHDLRVVGISFFRSSWDESVDEFYRDVLKQAPPRFGQAIAPRTDVGPDGRKINRYANY
ncbi:mitochondrial 54S ribosomal protein YmL35 [Coemansia guatemalensis]|uniref:Mitochondrial 54S ribosomal protein YmL35 n=1 Tax=Coemansia guatemalensis TaxID=2761395 RepID=A0A9W8HUJ0_9FUNG|nr:mitochondrial 54S ribosomal protein YmL35 [Coemansia guatemalensis]